MVFHKGFLGPKLSVLTKIRLVSSHLGLKSFSNVRDSQTFENNGRKRFYNIWLIPGGP
jgi:hypothetical protein